MDTAKPGGSGRAAASCIYVDAGPFSWPYFAGISRYTAQLSLVLAARLPVRFFHEGEELLPPEDLGWSQDQDLEDWGRRIGQGRRRPLEAPPGDSIGLYGSWTRPGHRSFPYEVSILHDFCPIAVPWAFHGSSRDEFAKNVTADILNADLVVADSRSTKADAAWFSPLDPERIVVAHPGPSLCVQSHRHRGPVARSDRIGLVVSTIEPRKNAPFLFEWFHETTVLPPDMELWWVGKLGWMTSRAELERLANRRGGRRIRLLGTVSDERLCELYQRAGWSIYPSRYEGFGFPILDSLRHGTPVLASGTSSMAEFDHPGVFFFDPEDPATVDAAWRRLEAARPVAIPQAELDAAYRWDRVAGAILDAHASRPTRPRSGGDGSGRTPSAPLAPAPAGTAAVRSRLKARSRIGVEMFGTQSGSRNRGIGRYTRHFVAALLARDPVNEYVLYGREGLPTNDIPEAPNAVTRLLRPDPARGEATLSHVMEHLAETNPDGLDVLLLCDPLEMIPGYDIPARPLGGLRMASIVHDLIPLIFQEPCFPDPEWAGRYLQALERLRGHDALLAPSDSCRSDFVSLVGAAPDRVVTIGAASDGRFFVPDRSQPMPDAARGLLGLLGIDRPFVLSVGDADDRKDPSSLIAAFAMLPDELRRSHQLVLSYALEGEHRDRVEQYARDRGVVDHLVLTPWLSDRALRPLYQRCAAFVFPSMYEGFGLPILEAMHCGAPVIAGKNSSQVEVVGDAGLLFDAADSGELAGHLTRLLREPAWARELGDRAAVRARRFSWEATADRALEVLTRLHAPAPMARPRPAPRRTARRRIAFFSPLPPLASPVADQAARLLDELGRRYTVDVYHDAGRLPYVRLNSPELGGYDYRLFERNAGVLGYHALVYQMGDSHHHHYMYETLLRHPGVVALHDLGLAGFQFSYAQRPGVDGDAHIRRELEAACGARWAEAWRVIAARAEAPGGMAAACIERGIDLTARVFERSAAVIVASSRCLERVRMRSPAHLGKTSVVAIGASSPDQAWSTAAEAYEEVIERAAARRGRAGAHGSPSPSRPRIIPAPEGLQAAS